MLVSELEWDARELSPAPEVSPGTGRELFALMRNYCDGAETGASAMLVAAGF